MTLAETIKNIIGKKNEQKTEFQREQFQRRMTKILDAREKNANERELERYVEEDRQKRIDFELAKYRKRKQREMWHTDWSNTHGVHVLKNDHPILKQKKLFGLKGNILKSNGGFGR